ncbi:MAG: hypothetical protein K5930_07280 [Treponemataceae bacterium]|nr:hypothetical protein [Treponemataceae bacterium]
MSKYNFIISLGFVLIFSVFLCSSCNNSFAMRLSNPSASNDYNSEIVSFSGRIKSVFTQGGALPAEYAIGSLPLALTLLS